MRTLTVAQLAYLAGIMDGEGEFSINKYARKDSKKRIHTYGLKATVRISQARRCLLDSIAKDVGEGNINIGKAGRDGKYFYLRFKHAYLRQLIPLLLPYLRLKVEQATIVQEFIHTPRSIGRKGLGKAEWQRRLRLRNRCCRLNTTPQAIARHKENGTLPHYRVKTLRKPFISAVHNVETAITT